MENFFFFFFDFSNLRYIQKEKEILLTRFISGWQDNSLLYNCQSDNCSTPPQDNTPSSVDPEKFGETLSCLVEVLLFIARVTSYFIAHKLLDTVYYMSYELSFAYELRVTVYLTSHFFEVFCFTYYVLLKMFLRCDLLKY